MSRQILYLALMAWLSGLVLHGCGGGNDTSTPVTPVPLAIDIQWGARSRVVNAPQSALSARVTLAGGKTDGTDYLWTLNRPEGINATKTRHTAPDQVLSGTRLLTLAFHAEPDGEGAVVGTAQTTVILTSTDSDLPSIAVTGRVETVTLVAGQTLQIGEQKELAFTTKDAEGQTLAITPGSAFFTLVRGQQTLQLTADGKAKGLAPGDAIVTVTVDGKTSPPGTVRVAGGVSLSTNYTITDLGALPGAGSRAYDLNLAGQVVGESGRAFIWDSAQGMRELPTPNVISSGAMGINASGEVVGWAITTAHPNEAHPFLWRNGEAIDLMPANAPASQEGIAYAINDSGQVVGTLTSIDPATEDETQSGFLWENNTFTYLDPPTGYSQLDVRAINNAGVAVGSARTGSWDGDAIFVWNRAYGSQAIRYHTFAVGYAINNKNWILVSGYDDNSIGIYLYQDGQFHEVGSFMRRARGFDLNDAGLVVGESGFNVPRAHTFFGRTAGGDPAAANLNEHIPQNSGWTLISARAINARGQIVGYGTFQGAERAFLLTPQ